MYERLLDKAIPPTDDYIQKYLGTESYGNLVQFEKMLSDNYNLNRELKFPFGNNYGWGYKYSHKLNHLCYAFFESGAFTVTLQLGDACIPTINKILPALSEKANKLWESRYPCGAQGGWIHYRVTESIELNDILALIQAKRKPSKRSESC